MYGILTTQFKVSWKCSWIATVKNWIGDRTVYILRLSSIAKPAKPLRNRTSKAYRSIRDVGQGYSLPFFLTLQPLPIRSSKNADPPTSPIFQTETRPRLEMIPLGLLCGDKAPEPAARRDHYPSRVADICYFLAIGPKWTATTTTRPSAPCDTLSRARPRVKVTAPTRSLSWR